MVTTKTGVLFISTYVWLQVFANINYKNQIKLFFLTYTKNK